MHKHFVTPAITSAKHVTVTNKMWFDLTYPITVSPSNDWGWRLAKAFTVITICRNRQSWGRVYQWHDGMKRVLLWLDCIIENHLQFHIVDVFSARSIQRHQYLCVWSLSIQRHQYLSVRVPGLSPFRDISICLSECQVSVHSETSVSVCQSARSLSIQRHQYQACLSVRTPSHLTSLDVNYLATERWWLMTW